MRSHDAESGDQNARDEAASFARLEERRREHRTVATVGKLVGATVAKILDAITAVRREGNGPSASEEQLEIFNRICDLYGHMEDLASPDEEIRGFARGFAPPELRDTPPEEAARLHVIIRGMFEAAERRVRSTPRDAAEAAEAGRVRKFWRAAGQDAAGFPLHHAGHRRSSGPRPVRRRGSRRTTGARAGPDDPDEADRRAVGPRSHELTGGAP